MKTKQIVLTVILIAGIVYPGSAEEKKVVASKLNEATVFFRGAELSHTASSSLTKGENEIYIEGLSPNIDKNSLKIKTTNGVIVSSYEYTLDYLSNSKVPNATVKKLQDSIAIYEKKLEVINTDISITTNLLALLQKGTDKNVAGSEKGLGIDELVKTMEYYKSKSKELQEAQSANNRKKQEAEQSLVRLKNQLNMEASKNNKTSGVLKLSLSAPTTATCNFIISYYTPMAGWMPYYDINIASTDKPIRIVSKSKVRQTTGLDWEKVKLTLSTSVPSNGKAAPLFNAWFLDFYHPIVANEAKDMSVMAQNAFSYEMAEVVVSGPKAKKIIEEDLRYDTPTMEEYILQSENELNMVYSIDLHYSIPGNGKEQSIDLQTKETTAEYKYYCAPRLDTETYLLAEISDWQKLNLLSANANITYDGTYVGESYIDANSTQEKLALTLGSDKRVTVKREKMHDFSSTRFLGNDTKQVFTYKLTVRNNQNKPIKMVLKDQYPISTQKSIEVELITKDTTPWTANIESLGVITWEEELKAGETKEYRLSYSIKHPKNQEVR
ncbi:uncharacterized protein (TIGR02231 family) [Parabacteroides sp. PF5-5]|uniref:DUF4139 domain-containing protein n=1 Tax=unclassified Parabacteroides TaxID=2649774 RepID=UPI00247467FC|nr:MULTISPECIES: DUF4139 domain-containing protein [unclassified Parabacteroides]MDH6306006.1 uncharacterized protein (TIGR02231 family) [Parabacteroides sp. PH5-39]MDH6317262.1 uncharacterized protein (TIGR02231 family) [Parabacteroides sp. PF5-13]MDH6320718.1 uncharacterized protein (TIGR02231 family) [Parabacteroides sp. PH5-13]MDH6324361.1 uncharacterized protein (TIGR02231 family) [Parabacteroides sp. PH5-8]MDH6328447.1 uncharacterized protein (TIGR02231 family) [Parabacteroides sp. PH5-4